LPPDRTQPLPRDREISMGTLSPPTRPRSSARSGGSVHDHIEPAYEARSVGDGFTRADAPQA
jgi:hypothetical protein